MASARFWGNAPAGRATIPAGTAAAISLQQGQCLRLVNTGEQCVRLWAFAVNGSEYLSMEHSSSMLSKTRFHVGDSLVSSRRRPMITVTQDTSCGTHDTMLCACSAELYEQLGCEEYHANCEDNLHAALLEAQVPWPRACTPAPWNLWMHVDLQESGLLALNPPAAKRGDVLALRAECPLVVVASACPQDMGDTQNFCAKVVPQDVYFDVVSSTCTTTAPGSDAIAPGSPLGSKALVPRSPTGKTAVAAPEMNMSFKISLK